MNIIYRQGNLLQCEERILIHGCNAQGVMGAGVAKAIREKYPAAFLSYKSGLYQKTPTQLLGEIIWAKCGDKVIGNAITQRFFGKQRGTVYCSYEAIRKCMKSADYFVSQSPWEGVFGNRIAMPMIGAGLAGGSWEIIEAIIEEEALNFQPIVYYI